MSSKARLPLIFAFVLTLSGTAPHAQQAATEKMPPVLSWSQQVEVREGWLEKHHALLLPMMRKHNVGMWIVVNEEFHNDPLTEYVAPPRIYTGNRDIFVFVDAGEQGLKKFAVTGYAEESLKRFFVTPDDPRPPKEALKELYVTYQPKTIALGIDGDRGVTRSLTRSSYNFLADAMGPEAAKRFVPAAELIEDYLSTRIAEEFDTYTQMVLATEILTRRALSNEVIQPGKTRVGDVRRWLYDQLWQSRYTTWFQPDIRLQRQGMKANMSRGFLGVAPESLVIEPGDVLHIDFGITYMGLNTDWQKMAYVLKKGETAPPPGLIAAMAKTNALQDALTSDARPGKTAGELYRQVLAEMQARGIEAQVYSHPIGAQGHGLGPAINSRAGQQNSAEGAKPLVNGTYLSVELNTASNIPEWGGQKIFVMLEDDAYLTNAGYKFFRPRQTEYYLIH